MAIIVESFRTYWARNEINDLISFIDSLSVGRVIAKAKAQQPVPLLLLRIATTAEQLGVKPDEWAKVQRVLVAWSKSDPVNVQVQIPKVETEERETPADLGMEVPEYVPGMDDYEEPF